MRKTEFHELSEAGMAHLSRPTEYAHWKCTRVLAKWPCMGERDRNKNLYRRDCQSKDNYLVVSVGEHIQFIQENKYNTPKSENRPVYAHKVPVRL